VPARILVVVAVRRVVSYYRHRQASPAAIAPFGVVATMSMVFSTLARRRLSATPLVAAFVGTPIGRR